MIISDKTIKLLEFDKIRDAVASCAVSLRTKDEIIEELPSFDIIEIKRNLVLTQEGYKLLNVHLINPLMQFDEIDEILEKSRIGSTLAMGELLKVARVIKSARIARTTIEDAPEDIVELKKLTSCILIDRVLEKDITDCILSDTEMSDKASDKLYGLRRKLRNLNAKLKEKLLSYTKNNDSSKFLQDNLVTVREGRYVLPVKAECRGEVKGLVHDKSATGSTVYVEPFAIVELNNELKEVIAEEQAEVENILRDFTARVAQQIDALYLLQNACIQVDRVLCKAKYSTKIKGNVPLVLSEKRLFFKNSRHPLIDKNKVVPVTIMLNEKRILLISGPNTGGKTVCLKTVGLLCLMAYFGLYLPCDECELPLYGNIYCDIGDEQSIENELSTFSSHIKSLVEITENMDENSLVLLDEVGGGTDPSEGAALAIGIIKFIETKKASAVLTTHYGEVKEYALSSQRVENACMEFDDDTFLPTYRLVLGMPGTSNAINTAKRLGLNPEVVSNAISALSDEKIRFEKILRNAERIRKEATDELEETRKIKNAILLEKMEVESRKAQLSAAEERIKNNAAAETRRLVSSATERANEIIDEMKELMRIADEKSILQAKKLRSELEDLEYKLNMTPIEVECDTLRENEIKVGIEVIVKTIGTTATIKSVNIKKKEVEVQSGAIRTKVPFSALGKPIKKTQQRSAPQKPKTNYGERASSGFSEREVKVLGLTVSEAIEIIEPYIISMANEDDAKILRIVHGKGTGALGKGIQAFLKGHPFVLEYRYGRYGEGETGVTFATIK